MTSSGTSLSSSNKPIKKSVSFMDADIIEFEPTVWTASVSSTGVPVGMSGKERNRSRRRLDSYETERKTQQRIPRQDYMEEGYLEPEEREDILSAVTTHRSGSFDIAEQESIQINEERRESNENDVKYQFGLGEADLIHLEYDDQRMDEEPPLYDHRGNSINVVHSMIFQDAYSDDEDIMFESEDENDVFSSTTTKDLCNNNNTTEPSVDLQGNNLNNYNSVSTEAA